MFLMEIENAVKLVITLESWSSKPDPFSHFAYVYSEIGNHL